jgi:NADP-dependent 3-hydroxy acid dehydrogenase YdfG
MAKGAQVILARRNSERLQLGRRPSGRAEHGAFDATDPDRLKRFFADLPGPIDPLMVAAGSSYCAPLSDLDFTQVPQALDQRLLLILHIGQLAAGETCTSTAARRRDIDAPGIPSTDSE